MSARGQRSQKVRWALVGTFTCLAASCSPSGAAFVPLPAVGADEALFVVTRTDGRFAWLSHEPDRRLTVEGDRGDDFFLVVLNEHALRDVFPRIPEGAIASVELRRRGPAACTREFSTGDPDRREIPLSAVAPVTYKFDHDAVRLAPSSDLPVFEFAVDVPWTRLCAEAPPTLTAFELPGVGRITSASAYDGSRAVVINGAGELMLYELGPNPRRLATMSRLDGKVAEYDARVVRVCPQGGRHMAYLADRVVRPGGGVEHRVARFDVTADFFDAPELLVESDVRGLACEAPSTCVGGGTAGLIVSSTSATDFRTALGGPSGLTYQDVSVLQAGTPASHFLAGGDGNIYHGRIDGNRIARLATASSFALRTLATFTRGARSEVWAIDSQEYVNRIIEGEATGTRVDQLVTLGPEISTDCLSDVDECGHRVTASGFTQIASVSTPGGEPLVVMAVKDCAGLLAVDPESLCTYGFDVSAHASPGTQPRTLESRDSDVWITTDRALLRLSWP